MGVQTLDPKESKEAGYPSYTGIKLDNGQARKLLISKPFVKIRRARLAVCELMYIIKSCQVVYLYNVFVRSLA